MHPASVRKQILSFPIKLITKRREWREVAQESRHCWECCFPSQQGWLQAKLFLAGWQFPGAQAFGTLLYPQLLFPAYPALSSSIPLPERGWNCYLPTKKIQFRWSTVFQVHVEIILTNFPSAQVLRNQESKENLKTILLDFWCLNWKKCKKWTKLAGNGWDL